jgi:hypothetical protein
MDWGEIDISEKSRIKIIDSKSKEIKPQFESKTGNEEDKIYR